MNKTPEPKSALEILSDKAQIKNLTPEQKDSLIESYMDTINLLLKENAEFRKGNIQLSLALSIKEQNAAKK